MGGDVGTLERLNTMEVMAQVILPLREDRGTSRRPRPAVSSSTIEPPGIASETATAIAEAPWHTRLGGECDHDPGEDPSYPSGYSDDTPQVVSVASESSWTVSPTAADTVRTREASHILAAMSDYDD